MEHDNRPLSPDLQIYRPQLPFGPVDHPPHHGHRPERRRAAAGLLADRRRGGTGSVFSHTGLYPLVARTPSDVRMDVLAILSSLQRYTAPHLGCRLRLRAAHDLCLRVVGGGGEHGADRGRLDRQLRCERVGPMGGGQRMRSPLSRARGLGSAREGASTGGPNALRQRH